MKKFFEGFSFVEVTNSSNITAFGYDFFNMKLRIKYKGDVCYDYKDINPSIAIDLFTLSKDENASIGSYIHTYIKSIFQCEKVSFAKENEVEFKNLD